MEFSLCDLKVGECGTVVSVKSKGDILRRLLDIGVISGTRVKCVLKSPLGDPTAYLIRGAVMALRKEDCLDVMVKVNEPLLVVNKDGTYGSVGRLKRRRG